MSSKCAACGKTAYPLESQTALGVVYHKSCFKCEVCKCTLNVKTFKGLEGKIYCPTHTPVSRASTSADSVSVKTAQSAPKKKAEGLAVAYKGDAKTAKGPAGEVVKSTDAAPSATDQSVSGGGTATRLGDAGAGYAPEESDEPQQYEEQAAEEQYEEQPAEEQYEEQPAEEEQYDE